MRLAPAALAAWAAAWTLTGAAAPPRAASSTVVAASAGALLALLTLGWRRLRLASPRGHGEPQPPRGRGERQPPRATAARARPARAVDRWPRILAALAASRRGQAAPRLGWRSGTGAAHVLLALGAVAAVALSAHVDTTTRAPLALLATEHADAVLHGRVVTDPAPASFGTGQRWELAADSLTARAVTTSVRGRIEVTTPTAPPYGARVVVRARLSPARPGDAAAARATGDAAQVTRAPPAVVRVTNAMRAALRDVTADLSPQAQGLVPGIAVGDTSRLPPDLADAFRATGLTHLTAVSGGHFAIVLALVTALAGAVRAPRAARVALVAVVAAAFVLLVRPDPSVQRAAAMCAVTLLGLVLGRPAASVPSLAVCVVALLCADPWLARSFGFALSCAATAGLVLLAPALVRRLTPWLGRAGAFALAVPVAAQAACGPVLVLLSPGLPTTSVLANLLAAPAVAPATLLGLGATVIGPGWPAAARVLAWLAGGATWWIAAVARWCAALPGAALPWPGGPPGAFAMLAATVAAFVLVLRREPAEGWAWTEIGRRTWRRARTSGRATFARCRRGVATHHDRRVATAVCGAALALVLLAVAATTAFVRALPVRGSVPADWQVVACDVGQGDALAVRTGPASAIVVDTGPPGDAAGHCLDRLGVTRVDLLVLTHDHLDHVGGLAGVLAGRRVRAAWVSPLDEPAANARRAAGALEAAGLAPAVPVVGDGGTVGEGPWAVGVRVLGTGTASGSRPAGVASGSAEGDGVNDASLALDLTSRGPGGTIDVVALGDLEEPGQEALLAALRATGPPGVTDGVDVVKVAHHGSASQSAGLARLLHPRVALVSVGAGNTYGHPTDRMLALYAAVGATTVRTDECGSAVLVARHGRLALACG
ncbi:ComEC/Rec2 family competence protein [Xylanimonas allomyrinae]|uniref:ComEC/Rec2 family competence protein n=1 Tax=Xylanimonas allomyrinae TaxID=2509459 RepID=A0A4P6EQK8_9MICO|nr:ComEC/Rec2 family competence protein [Xylanimonas allomyrinae]